jgi:RimJ/RimL family protein N-acetyltransferase
MTNQRLYSHRRLLALQIDTLFRPTPDGRLRCVNEAGDPPAPRFFLGRTRDGNLWRFHVDLPARVVERLEAICQAEPVTMEFTTPPRQAAAIRAVLAEHAPVQEEYRGPAYWIPPGASPSAAAVLITDSNAAVLQVHFPWLLATPSYRDVGPVAATVIAGQAVAVCFCARIPGGATEAGVETVESQRGRGYAAAAVARWAAAVRAMGCLPLYSTDWQNLASQGVAHKLGMVCYGEDWSVA